MSFKAILARARRLLRRLLRAVRGMGDERG